jgi:hypothetical protein
MSAEVLQGLPETEVPKDEQNDDDRPDPPDDVVHDMLLFSDGAELLASGSTGRLPCLSWSR